ncbi:MAG: S-adenosyl-L-homocysteine hydrolase [Pseudomonadota bacterium]
MNNKHQDMPDNGLWRAVRSAGMVMGFALAAALTSTPAQADDKFDQAHSLRSLDIMLMVTALRCRSGQHNFQSDYNRFSATHLPHLNAASRTLQRSFAASYGETNPSRALDRMGVKIANSYGDGHPWLSCAELQQVTRDLVQSADAASLARSARYLLGASRPQAEPQPTPQIAQSDPVQISYNMTADWEKRP